MSKPKIQAPRGTFDLLPGDATDRRRVEDAAREVLEAAGYGRIETPAFEATELFARGVGEATDVVQKEMYSFDDGGGRSMTLRPEGTAPVCRAYVEHGMHKLPQPVRVWYLSSFFRHEAPQSGRFRQFWQVGCEALGSDDPAIDAEQIILLDRLLDRLGVGERRLRVASLGSPDARAAYRDELREYLRSHEDRLSDGVRARIDLNPLRAFDSDDAGTQEVMAGAPRLLDRLEGDDAGHFAAVRALLDGAGLAHDVDPTLVRGLDYYTRTVFEYESAALGAQRGVGGGGRYDGLVEELGGPPTPGCGWAAGVERMLLAGPGDATPDDASLDLYVAYDAPGRRDEAFGLALAARDAGLRAQVETAGRSLKGQLKQADRAGARHVALLTDGATALREMASGEQRDSDPEAILKELAG